MRTKAAKYLLVGLLVAVALMPVALLVAAMMLAGDYDGYCSSLGFGGPPRPCSWGEYVAQLMLVLGIYVVLEWWWLLLLVLALPPAVGFLIGRQRPAGPSPR